MTDDTEPEFTEWHAGEPWPNSMAHLDPAAQAVAACDACQRKTWASGEIGKPCSMRQPDGSFCAGRFR